MKNVFIEDEDKYEGSNIERSRTNFDTKGNKF